MAAEGYLCRLDGAHHADRPEGLDVVAAMKCDIA